jgi:hypothetical protein
VVAALGRIGVSVAAADWATPDDLFKVDLALMITPGNISIKNGKHSSLPNLLIEVEGPERFTNNTLQVPPIAPLMTPYYLSQDPPLPPS